MSPVKKTLSLGSVYLGLEFLVLAVSATPGFPWSNQPVPALLTAVQSFDAPSSRLNLPAKDGGRVDSDKNAETTTDVGCFFAANHKPAQVFFRGAAVVPACFKVILTPKVSRCISKSVLDL